MGIGATEESSAMLVLVLSLDLLGLLLRSRAFQRIQLSIKGMFDKLRRKRGMKNKL